MILFWIGEWILKEASKSSEWDSSEGEFAPTAPAPVPVKRIDWSPLRARDENFSRVVFEDFLYALYARVHEARGDDEAMAALAPYVVPGAREAIAQREPVGVRISQVVVGSMTLARLRHEAERERFVVSVEFESNVSAEHGQTWYLQEHWTLVRDESVQSKEPEQASALKCPNCGAPFVSTAEQACQYCGRVVDTGRFDWLVERTRLLRSVELPPQLGGYAPEVGTHAPTMIGWGFRKRFAAFLAEDPKLEQAAIEARIRRLYDTLNTAWVARNLDHARAYLSDGICDYLNYWLDAYRRQGLINCLEDMTLESMEFVELSRDRYYDALTVRIFASGLDYTIRESDEKLVGGTPKIPRRYSEYWTLIRGAGVRGEAHSDGGCPNCGAPLSVNMGGSCEHCGAHLTRGEFDWVLSRIEQDESYTG